MDVMDATEINLLLDAAISVASNYEGLLGSHRKGKAQKTLEALRSSTLRLSNPESYVERLSKKRFEASGLELAPEIEQAIQKDSGHVHYLIPSPVLLHPERGARYRLLECSFEIATTSDRALGIVRMFPEPRFKPVLSVGAKFTLGVDTRLNWGVELKEATVDLGKFKGDLASRVGNKDELHGFLKVLPFEYTLGRREIEANFSNDTAIWRFDSKSSLRKDANVCPTLLVRVPEHVRQLTVKGVAQAEVEFDWFFANIEHVIDRLPEFFGQRAKERRGPPLPVQDQWKIALPHEKP